MIAKIFPTSMQWCTSSIHKRADGQVYHLQKSKDHCQGQTAQVAAEEPTTQQVWSMPPAYKGWAGDYLQTEDRPQPFKPSPLPQIPDWRVSMPDSQPDNRTPAAWLSFAWSSQAPHLNKGDTSGAEASCQPGGSTAHGVICRWGRHVHLKWTTANTNCHKVYQKEIKKNTTKTRCLIIYNILKFSTFQIWIQKFIF